MQAIIFAALLNLSAFKSLIHDHFLTRGYAGTKPMFVEERILVVESIYEKIVNANALEGLHGVLKKAHKKTISIIKPKPT